MTREISISKYASVSELLIIPFHGLFDRRVIRESLRIFSGGVAANNALHFNEFCGFAASYSKTGAYFEIEISRVIRSASYSRIYCTRLSAAENAMCTVWCRLVEGFDEAHAHTWERPSGDSLS